MAVAAGGSRRRRRRRRPAAARPQARRAARLESFADLVALAGEKRDLKLKHALETAVRPIRFERGRIEMALTERCAAGLAGELVAEARGVDRHSAG